MSLELGFVIIIWFHAILCRDIVAGCLKILSGCLFFLVKFYPYGLLPFFRQLSLINANFLLNCFNYTCHTLKWSLVGI